MNLSIVVTVYPYPTERQGIHGGGGRYGTTCFYI